MEYFDLHCDTMAVLEAKGGALKKNNLHVDLQRAQPLSRYVQCYAAFVPDTMQGEAAFSYFLRIAETFRQQAAENRETFLPLAQLGDINRLSDRQRFGGLLTVENGAALGGKLKNLHIMKQLGVKAITLTWNGENELGGGAMTGNAIGLTAFGREALREMEQLQIVADVSHASEVLFWDVMEASTVPVMATHSNAKAICDHPRNLSDDQFRAICQSGGLVGLNFFREFLHQKPERATMMDILRHAEHFLALGGAKHLAMGSDFDGADLPNDFQGLESIGALYELFLQHNHSEALVQDLFYRNATKYFHTNNLL